MVKEADALTNAGYQVTVLYAYWNNWGTQYDDNLLPQKKWQAIRVGGAPNSHKLTYLLSRSIQKAARIIFKKTNNSYFADLAIARSSYFLIREARKYQADIYIGHNLGGLPATFNAAKKHNKPWGFDAEDFHRHEMSNDPGSFDSTLKRTIEEKYIPQANYLTTSSPLITNEYHKLFPDAEPVTILNVFSNESINPVINESETLKLLWASQTIGANRGLENVIEALVILDDAAVELHLLGELPDGDFKNYLFNKINQSNLKVIVHQPINSTEIIEFSSQFDIGLALEPGFSLNNEFALSNKIFSYLQSGLAVVASCTPAQKAFIAEYPQVGKTFASISHLVEILKDYQLNKNLLNETKLAALKIAHEQLNWDRESQKFLAVIKKVLDE